MWKLYICLLLLLFGVGFSGSASATTLKSENLENCAAISCMHLAAICPVIFYWHIDSGRWGVGGGVAKRAKILCFSVNKKAHLSLACVSFSVKAYRPPRLQYHRRLSGAHMPRHLLGTHRRRLQGSVLTHDILHGPSECRRHWHCLLPGVSDSARRSPRHCHMPRICLDPRSRGSPWRCKCHSMYLSTFNIGTDVP